MATCAVSTVKNEPSTMLKASRTMMAMKNRKNVAMLSLPLVYTLAEMYLLVAEDGGILPQPCFVL